MVLVPRTAITYPPKSPRWGRGKMTEPLKIISGFHLKKKKERESLTHIFSCAAAVHCAEIQSASLCLLWITNGQALPFT